MASIPENQIDTETPSFSETDAPPAALQNQSYEVQDVQEVQVVEEVPEAQPEQEAPAPQEEHVENGAPPQNTEVADHDHLNSDEGKLFFGRS